MLHQYMRQQSSTAQNQQSNKIRNMLQQHIRNLIGSVYRQINNGITDNERQQLIGELKGYVSMRKHLAPVVTQDGYASSIYRAISDLESVVDDSGAEEIGAELSSN